MSNRFILTTASLPLAANNCGVVASIFDNAQFCGGANTSSSISITYANLQSLIAASALEVNSSYLITDYQTIYDQPDFTALGAPKAVVATLSGSIEPLIVIAVSSSTLYAQAKSTIYPQDIILYNVQPGVTPVMGQATKGLITFRTDSSNNTSWYDSRAVLFKRYESLPGSGVFSVINDNGGASQSILTFTGGCYNIQNGLAVSGNTYTPNVFGLPNNVFENGCFNLQAGYDFYNNTFVNALFNDSIFQDNCHDNVFLGGGYNNNVQNSFFSNEFQGLFQNNHIQNGFRLNTFTGVMQSNTVLSGFRSNTISDFLYNTIGYDFLSNVVSSGFINNTIYDNFQSNTIASNFNNNKISNGFINNIIVTTDFQQNDVKVPCVGILSWALQPTLYLGAYCVVINGFDNFGAVQAQPLLGYYNTTTGLWVYSGL